MTRSMRRGVTLFQLLIVIAILALLVALFLPATVQIRIAAARAQSQNNIKQLGLSIHIYHDANQFLPPGSDKQGFSTFAQVLPFLEQDQVFKLIDFTKPPTDEANAKARNVRIRTFISPLDNVMPMNESGPTNYLFAAGSKAALKDNDGLFTTATKLRFADVTDGLSNTVMVGETLRGDGGVKASTVARQHVRLKADALNGIKPEAGVAQWKDDKDIAADRGAACLEGRMLQTLFTATRPINDDKPDVDCGGAGGLSALRTPIDVVNVGLMDGSVRSVRKTIDFKVWQAANTRAGGEPITLD